MGKGFAGCRRRAMRGLTAIAMAGLVSACELIDTGEDDLSSAMEAARSPETLMRLGAFAEVTGDLETAARFYGRAHEVAPENPEPLIRLGTLLSAAGAHGQAAQAFRTLQALQPNNREVARALGNALIASGRPEAAVAVLGDALRVRADALVLSGLGVAYDMMGRHDDAQASYGEALFLTPDDPDIRTNLALSHALAGNYPLAIEIIGAVTAEIESTRRHRQALALVLGLADRPDEAAEAAGRDLDASGVDQAMRYYEQLRALPSSGDRARAIGGVPLNPA